MKEKIKKGWFFGIFILLLSCSFIVRAEENPSEPLDQDFSQKSHQESIHESAQESTQESSRSLGIMEHHLLRRFTVFPIQIDSPQLADAADDAWWKLRETLTENHRFLVASKSYMQQKDVFQSRGELSPADAIILGKLLDANGLIVTFLKNRSIFMHVYEGENGRTIWHQDFQLQPSLTAVKQLGSAVQKLILSFMASIPYQGFVVMDPLIGKVIDEVGGKWLVRVEIGENSSVSVGDQVQFLKIQSASLKPLFSEVGNTEVLAEGRVVNLNHTLLTVEIVRASNFNEIKEGTLVRLPRELTRLRDIYGRHDSLSQNFLDPSILPSGMQSTQREVAEKKPLYTALSFIANLALFLILAF